LRRLEIQETGCKGGSLVLDRGQEVLKGVEFPFPFLAHLPCSWNTLKVSKSLVRFDPSLTLSTKATGSVLAGDFEQ
jgi:hypothetical protein